MNKWNLCKDILPNFYEDVLICDVNNDIYISFLVISKTEIGWYINGTKFNVNDNYVLAWMPLPEPYKED